MAALHERTRKNADARTVLRPPPPEDPPLAELEFAGCEAVPMSYEELRRYEGRLEVWDARVRTAWMVGEPTSPTHENPSHGLTGLVRSRQHESSIAADDLIGLAEALGA